MIVAAILGLLAVAGAILWFFAIRVPPPKATPELDPAHEVPGFESTLLARVVELERPHPGWAIGIAIALAIVLGAPWIVLHPRELPSMAGPWAAVSAILVAAFVYWTWLRLRTPRVVRLLRERAHEIVGITPERIELRSRSSKRRIAQLNVALRSGTHVLVAVPWGTEDFVATQMRWVMQSALKAQRPTREVLRPTAQE